MLLALFTGIGYLTTIHIHSFLAQTQRVETPYLVIEGWVHEFAIQAGAAEFRRGGYSKVFVTGGPVTGSGGYTWDADTSASVGAGLLRQAGLAGAAVQMVPAHMIGRDRTYFSALALRDWFTQMNIHVDALNVVTESAHARRTRLLFQEAFGTEVRIGILSVPNPDYDAEHWWESSEGFREVVGEAIAYVYARLFFFPPRSTTTL